MWLKRAVQYEKMIKDESGSHYESLLNNKYHTEIMQTYSKGGEQEKVKRFCLKMAKKAEEEDRPYIAAKYYDQAVASIDNTEYILSRSSDMLKSG